MQGTTGTTVTTTTTAPAPAKAAPAKRAPATKVAPFTVLTLVVNAQQAQAAKALVAQRTPPGVAAAKLGLSGGKYAMACYNAGTTPTGQPLPQLHYGSKLKGAPTTPTALALAIARTHNPGTGYSWGKVAAIYRVTETCARIAFSAGKGGASHRTVGVPGSAWAHRNG